MANRLASESSPYLRQHADNPVDWYPWSTEAFDRARQEDKAVLLSIGYAACHWCHVMAHESFEDDETAALMNQLFVNIKVDREERPDIDSIYMQAVQAMTGQGGWPMTVFLTPDGVPYWGGTYFPPHDRQGMPSFRRVLTTVAAAWRDKRDAVARTADAMSDLYANSTAIGGPSGAVSGQLLESASAALVRRHDRALGGFEGAPKFPQTMALDFLLRRHAMTGDTGELQVVTHSFRSMARGGIYDQVGGGFHRYSVDAEWLVPHFEKMLYDNALLVRLGIHLWQVTGDSETRRIVEETLAWVAREMTDEKGGFYSSLDADSEGEEGKFYVWDAAELDDLLGEDANTLRSLWRVGREGNFEGKSILHVPHDPDVVAVDVGISLEELEQARLRGIARLYNVRSKRVWPGRDEKVLAGWNGLMLRAFADCARILDSEQWLRIAERNGAFLRDHLVSGGRVHRVYMEGRVKVPGFLEDHAAVALAFLALHEATLDPAWLVQAREIGEAMTQQFRDPTTGAWYDTADDAEPLITRPRDLFDNATPAGPSLALELMLWLSELDGDPAKRSDVEAQLAILADPMLKWPNGFGHLLGVTQLALYGATTVVLMPGESGSPVGEFQRVASSSYRPHLLIASPGDAGMPVGGLGSLPIFAGREAKNGQTTAYLCRNFSCDLPALAPQALAVQLTASSLERET